MGHEENLVNQFRAAHFRPTLPPPQNPIIQSKEEAARPFLFPPPDDKDRSENDWATEMLRRWQEERRNRINSKEQEGD